LYIDKENLYAHPADKDHKVIVNGQAVDRLPSDLYIPPHALRVLLSSFEGPLDLLLYLIRYKDLSILDIPIFEISNQYVQYIEMMVDLELELVGEYLLMAATLAEIKSRMLLPKLAVIEDEDTDPRADLVRRLQEYEQIKYAAEMLDQLPQMNRDFYLLNVDSDKIIDEPPPVTSIELLCQSYLNVIDRMEQLSPHQLMHEPLSVRERMSLILDGVNQSDSLSFLSFIKPEEGRLGVVVTFLALLELIKSNLVLITQVKSFSIIYISSTPNQGALI
jgi:segregation and condensation protein A